MMTIYEFALKLNREITDAQIEALYEAGCDDAVIETGPLGAVASFDRAASSLAHAIASAARDVEKVPGLRAVGVRCDNMVNLLGIARRSGVTREAVRLWATGRRGPGSFPKPEIITAGGEQIWDWIEVAPWIDQHQAHGQGQGQALFTDATTALRIASTADRVLAARDALKSEPDSEVRQELERLLEDA